MIAFHNPIDERKRWRQTLSLYKITHLPVPPLIVQTSRKSYFNYLDQVKDSNWQVMEWYILR